MTEKEKLFDLCRQKGYCNLEPVFEQCAIFLFYTSWYEELLFNNKKERDPETHKIRSPYQHNSKNDKIVCQALCHDYHINVRKYNSLGDYFSARYIDSNGQPTRKFARLHLGVATNEVFNNLTEYSTNGVLSWKLLWSYLQIVYRFRNNMFHGGKGMENLQGFNEEFEQINSFMHQFISDILKSEYKGFNS